MKLHVLTSLGAALLMAAPLAGAQPPSSAAGGDRSAAAEGCVIAGPSYGYCRALGRYSQSYRDVEGGLRTDYRAAAAGRPAGDGSAPVRVGSALAAMDASGVAGQGSSAR